MTFSSRPKIIAIRTFQVLMPVFTIAIFTKKFPSFSTKVLWLVCLAIWEWFSYNIVEACVDENGLTYYRWFVAKHVSWDAVCSVSLWRTAGGFVIVTAKPFFPSRYLFLLDSKPGIETIETTAAPDDPIEIIRLRHKLESSQR